MLFNASHSCLYQGSRGSIIEIRVGTEELKSKATPDDGKNGSQHHSIRLNCHWSNIRSHELQYIFSIPQ